MSVHFNSNSSQPILPEQKLLKEWIQVIIKNHNKQLGRLNYLFCNDEDIYNTNLQYLNHDTYTDIITFDYVEGNVISGDILISIDRVGDNAKSLNVPFEQELCRVIIHGVLHLLGYKDKSVEESTLMRQKENESLAIFDTMKSQRFHVEHSIISL